MTEEYPFLHLDDHKDMSLVTIWFDNFEQWMNDKEPAYNLPRLSTSFTAYDEARLSIWVSEKALAQDETADIAIRVRDDFEIFFRQLRDLEKKVLDYQRGAADEEIKELVGSISEEDFKKQLKMHLLDIMEDKDLMMDIFGNFKTIDTFRIKSSKYRNQYTDQIYDRAEKVFKDLIESL